MKLVLASQGFTTPEIADAVAKVADKPLDSLNVAVINEAYIGIDAGQSERWLVNELHQLSQYVAGDIYFVNLRAYDIAEVGRRLAHADLVYIVGGAQLVLPQLFKETGFDTLLAELAQSKVIMGTSAGANILGRHIEDAAYWQDQYGSSRDYLANPFLGLAPFNVLPHFEREDHPMRNRQRLTPLLQNHPFPLYGITDTQAIILDEDKTIFVGGEPVVFGEH